MQAGPGSSAAQQVLPDGPEPVVFEVEYTPTEQLEPLEDAEAQSKVCTLRRLPTVGQHEALRGLQDCFCILYAQGAAPSETLGAEQGVRCLDGILMNS